MVTFGAFVFRAQELCESRGGCPGLPVPNSPYGLCGRKATLNSSCEIRNIQDLIYTPFLFFCLFVFNLI